MKAVRLLALAALLVACDDGGGVSAPPVDAAPPPPDVFAGPDVCYRAEEICDGVDNDCDGLIDEADPDLQQRLFEDPDNCGACGQACGPYERATPACLGGTCYISACEEGFYDYNAVVEDGCESDCLITANGVEICDGLDNNCDGQTDEGFDLQADIDHCGACAHACPSVDNGLPGCLEGVCGIGACDAGFIDLNGQPEDGCEYACSPTSTAAIAEFCNGRDDDCDGEVDEPEDLVIPEDLCGDEGVCAPECAVDGDCAAGEVCVGEICGLEGGGPTGEPCAEDLDCAAVHPGYGCLMGACAPRVRHAVCDGEAGFRCMRGPDFQALNEAGHCDGLDNDCDGRVDEDFAEALSTPCEAGRGVCRRSAEPRCAEDGVGVVCEVEPGEPEGPDEDCDGRDDDCDGEVDEDYTPTWVALDGFAIFAYEASRPGATAEAPGWDPIPDDEITAYVQGRACSEPDVLPWADVTWAQASEACAAVGARLCTAEEWAHACGGAGAEAYPYGDIYAAPMCNGGGRDDDPGTPGLQDALTPCGALESCARGGVYDLSGNLKEWIDAEIDGLRPVRGGGFETNPPEGLRCDLDVDLKAPDFTSHAIGFRCCQTLAP